MGETQGHATAPRGSKGIASPVATGGWGADFERHVGASYLVTLLLGVAPRGLDAGVAARVAFQRRHEGKPLDDLVVRSSLADGEAELTLQIKRDLHFTENDGTFDEVIHACWATFAAPTFDAHLHRFGIAVGIYRTIVDEYYQSVLTWARTSVDAADFFGRVSVERLSHRAQRDFVGLMRAKLDACVGGRVGDDRLWRFLRSMVILHFDFPRDGSRDYAHAVALAAQLIPPGRGGSAPDLFARLVACAAQGHTTAGGFDATGLRQRLRAADVALLPAPDCRRDLERLRAHASYILRDIRTDIGGIVLNRAEVVCQAATAAREARLLEITGLPGAGKSAILKAVIEARRGQGPALVLAGDRLEGRGWDGLARALGLAANLEDILVALGSAERPTIFIDGIDRVVETGARLAVNDLLRATGDLSSRHGGAGRWTVVLSTREENRLDLYRWLDWRPFGEPQTLRIPPLTHDEIALVVRREPHLRSLLALDHLAHIVANPFFLSVLHRRPPHPPGTPPSPAIASEGDVGEIWWEDIVGGDAGRGRARQQAIIGLGERVAAASGRRVRADDVGPDVLDGLVSDGILVRDPDRDLYGFAHDVLEEWTLCRVLNLHREALGPYLRDIAQPPGLLRPLRLLGASLLEKGVDARAWAGLIAQIEATLGLTGRWREALLTAPFASSRVRELLDKVEPYLVADDGGRLVEVLMALRTVEVEPDLELRDVLSGTGETSAALLPYLLHDPVPRWAVWRPTMGWLLDHRAALPVAMWPEMVRLMEMWQKRTATGSPYREEIGRIALALLAGAGGDGRDA